jgi:hypothetical protein
MRIVSASVIPAAPRDTRHPRGHPSVPCAGDSVRGRESSARMAGSPRRVILSTKDGARRVRRLLLRAESSARFRADSTRVSGDRPRSARAPECARGRRHGPRSCAVAHRSRWSAVPRRRRLRRVDADVRPDRIAAAPSATTHSRCITWMGAASGASGQARRNPRSLGRGISSDVARCAGSRSGADAADRASRLNGRWRDGVEVAGADRFH